MKVSFEGIGEKVVSFQAEGAVEEGALVKVGAAGAVAPCASGDVPVGVVQKVCHGLAAVQVAGCMKAPCAAGTAAGFALLAAGEDGALAASATGRPGFVLDVEASGSACWVLF